MLSPEEKNRQVIQTQNHLYDGWIYRKFIDPALIGIRRRITKLISKDSTVLDVGCGTGNQLIHLAPQIKYGLGIELSETMINTCRQQVNTLGITHCEFQLADASSLPHLNDMSFDFAISSMVIHEMPTELRLPVLSEMKRLGKTIILADWIYPQPSRWKKLSTHIMERMAGRDHYSGFTSFIKAGGMPQLLKRTGMEVLETQITGKGTIQLWVCRPE